VAVLADDSDYMVFGVDYIPLSSLSWHTESSELHGNLYSTASVSHVLGIAPQVHISIENSHLLQFMKFAASARILWFGPLRSHVLPFCYVFRYQNLSKLQFFFRFSIEIIPLIF
jgi:hypothetical protein